MTMTMTTTEAEIDKAVAFLRAGALVAFPTETVYGLGGDASNAVAVRKIFRAKERPYDHPLIVHIAHREQLSDWARDIPPAALQLAQAFWPGPLTMIFKKQPHVLDVVTGGQDTVGLRIPSHPIAQALLAKFAAGVAAPSANKFTHLSPTSAAAVREELGADVDMILDGGDCAVGLESTIVSMVDEHPIILRPGMITADMIATVLATEVLSARQDTPVPRAPGTHHLHYAPTTLTELMTTNAIAAFVSRLNTQDLPIAFVMHSKQQLPASVHSVTMAADASTYAHDLYRTLRALDHQQFKRIIIEAVPETSAWDAIRDRILKATAVR